MRNHILHYRRNLGIIAVGNIRFLSCIGLNYWIFWIHLTYVICGWNRMSLQANVQCFLIYSLYVVYSNGRQTQPGSLLRQWRYNCQLSGQVHFKFTKLVLRDRLGLRSILLPRYKCSRDWMAFSDNSLYSQLSVIRFVTNYILKSSTTTITNCLEHCWI